MKCPNEKCGSEKIENVGSPLASGGKTWYGKKCQECGYFWSDNEAPKPKLIAPAPAAELQGVPDQNESTGESGRQDAAPPAGNAQAPVEKILAAADGFDESKLEVGDVVIFADKEGQQKRLTIVSTALKTVLGDVDGKPDQRIRRDAILGVVVRE